MKKIVMYLVICLMSFLLIGCGNKTEMVNNSYDDGNVNEKTKVNTIADSYEKYSTLKSSAYDMLNDALEESNKFNFSLSMGLLGFATLDLTLIPMSFCGLDNETTLAGLSFLYSNIDYKSTKDTCKITFDTDSGTMTYDTKYDKKTDSVQTKVYSNGELNAISEYIKLNQGYATQFYSIEPDETKVYKSIFDSEKIIVGMQLKVSEPESLFKNASLATEEWTKSQDLWSKYENGSVSSFFNGQEY